MIHIVECCVCNKMAKANVVLHRINICSSCETKMLDLKVGHREYLRYKEGMKRLVRALMEA